ncbi:tautomerase family protein [Flavobacterium hercynium]|uniref:4-oxalocrotonate tautomerase n=1 Tax=Flavobacterium hercynium TaxID=387094 RepID=A0A226H508_9FLAO|nr:tautomerase family protein [Flavobacterium hercynium]OXA88958.1 4-oxalocrotonate tautomerase [Flavobacterium hercynium]SMP28389.1 4-oxalocrotonate tautomerase [Flavobacterium hercynium]
MPHVNLKMYPGTSEEQKEKIAQEITNIIIKHTGKPEAAVSIEIAEVAEDVWMEEVYNKEIKPNIEKLYKKPGY